MTLEKIKSRYDGKCSDCGRDIKVNWDIFYDKSEKKAYCTVCGRKREGEENTTSDRALTQEEFNALPEEIQERLKDLIKIRPPSIEEKIDALQAEIEIASGSITFLIDTISQFMAETQAQLSSIITKLNEKVVKESAKKE